MTLKEFLGFMELDYRITPLGNFILIDTQTKHEYHPTYSNIKDLVNHLLLDMYTCHIVDMTFAGGFEDTFDYIVSTDNELVKRVAICLINPELITLE